MTMVEVPKMARFFLAALSIPAVALVAKGSSPVFAEHHTCGCSFTSAAMSCSVSRNCHEDNCAVCSCTNEGCTGSCHICSPDGGDDLQLKKDSASVESPRAVQHFEAITLNNTNLKGLKEHLERVPGEWKVVIGVKSDVRVTRTFENITLDALVHALAQEFGACGLVNQSARTISFLPPGTCK